MKKVSSQSIIGQMGANLIERLVLQMRYVWRPVSVFDVGIDGEIEVCDPVTGRATNSIIKVQAKATTQPFTAETASTFEYRCEQKDLDYWLHGNAPIILVVCRPDTGEAYWVSVKDYFRDLSAQKARKVQFDKGRDRFDVSCAAALRQLALPQNSGIYFDPLPRNETLYCNLLKVASFGSKIHVADTDYRTPGELWAQFKALGARVGPEWILTNKRIISFQDLDCYPFDSICDPGTRDSFDASEWAYADDEERRREFVRLLNLCLREKARLLGLRFFHDRNREYYYFPPTKSLSTRQVRYKAVQLKVRREVFKGYGKKGDPNQRAYCRHSAFRGYFLYLGNEWYLEITPTYHFTFDGYKEDMFHAERLKGIKRLERNPAVLGHLLMWADYLSRPMRDLFSLEYPFLSFGDLVTVEAPIGLPDNVWYRAEEGSEAYTMRASDNQLALVGL